MPPCGADPCFVPHCQPLGITPDDLECRFGKCTFRDRFCDESLVVCDAPKPECEDGTVPEVEGGCWTNVCLPAKACDVVPDCSYCQAGEACVQMQTQLGPKYECHPIPPGCGDGRPDCDCAGADYCQTPFDQCSDAGDAISCSCPVCDDIPLTPWPVRG